MGLLGSALNYGTLPGLIGKGSGWYDLGGSVEGGLQSGLDSLNRGKNEFRDPGQPGDYQLPGYQQSFDQRGQLADGYAGRGSDFRGQQQGLANRLHDQAFGIGPSVADMQMQRGLQASLAQQQALAATGRGNAVQSARSAAMNAGQIGAQASGAGAIARLQEQQQAAGLLGQILGQSRGQDINQMQTNDQAQLEALRQQAMLQQLQQQGAWQYQNQRGSRFGALTQTPTTGEQVLSGVSGLLGFLGA